MGVIVGIDEAGLGPNLGPFVVTAIAWEVSGLPADCDFAVGFSEFLTDALQDGDPRLVVADSKGLFVPHESLAVPERTVLALLASWRAAPRTLRELDRLLHPQAAVDEIPPWLVDREVPLPVDVDVAEVETAWRLLQNCQAGRIRHIESRIVQPREFNRRLQSANKAAVTSACHLEVLTATCRAVGDDDLLVISDKHGGRNSYGAMLSAAFAGAWIDVLAEGALLSRYRVGRLECRFEPRAERYLPVAMASMISKYVREAHLRPFNQFWAERVPGLRPTQGYPQDARRFAAQIADEQRRLEIPHDVLWRAK